MSVGADGLSGDNPESLHIEKLRKYLVFMWRLRLYLDVRIVLTSNFGSTHMRTRRRSSVSRSPYFQTELAAWLNAKPSANGSEPPCPHSHPLHAQLHIHRHAHLLTSLVRPLQRLRHPAVIPLPLALNAARRSPGAHYPGDDTRAVPRVRPPLRVRVPNPRSVGHGRVPRPLVCGAGVAFRDGGRHAQRVLERGAPRGLLGLAKRTTPRNAFAKLWAAEHALRKIGRMIEPWGDVVREMLGQGRAGVDEVLVRKSERYFDGVRGGKGLGKMGNGREGEEGEGEGTEMEIMRGGRARFEAGERVEWAMVAVPRGVREP
ncbi:hypothetical protein CVT25_004266 [Psilocybe cyanescens]|uniref:Uncharacterized protein n=1 Tax=Psilocybe cyanescens TaxID=93625 RepID=A0A409WXL8_PSICY|nr:hypothetical protein CVT25_004266 [Psilocybe cyanescens]